MERYSDGFTHVALFFVELAPQNRGPTESEISMMGAYTCSVPNEQLAAFKEQAAHKGGYLEQEAEGKLRYSFRGKKTSVAVDSLAWPYMFRH